MKIIKIRKLWCLLAIMALCATFMVPVHAKADPTVNCDADGVGLQKKLDNAADGATVGITGSCDEGPYVISNGNLKLRGFEGAVLSGPGGSAVLSIQGAGNVELRNFDINANGFNSGIHFLSSSGEIRNVLVENAQGNGISVTGSSRVNVFDSTSRQNNIGISFVNSTGFLFNNTIENNSQQGISVTGASKVDIYNRTVRNNDI